MNLDSMDVCINLAEIEYIKKMKSMIDFSGMSDYMLRKYLFPSQWNYIDDKKLKLLMLKEALEKCVVLRETDLVINYYRKL